MTLPRMGVVRVSTLPFCGEVMTAVAIAGSYCCTGCNSAALHWMVGRKARLRLRAKSSASMASCGKAEAGGAMKSCSRAPRETAAAASACGTWQ